jgi:hypothetical protein
MFGEVSGRIGYETFQRALTFIELRSAFPELIREEMEPFPWDQVKVFRSWLSQIDPLRRLTFRKQS